MANQGRIIATIDPHGSSTAAAQLGARLARGLGTALELFTPVYNPHVTLAHFEGREAMQHARDTLVRRHLQHLEQIAAGLGFDGPVNCHAAWDHPLEEAMIRHVLDRGATMLVAHLPAGESLSSAQWQLVRHCPVPLLLTRGRQWSDTPTVVAAVDPTGRHGRADELDVRILGLADRVAAGTGGTMHAFHAWERALRYVIGGLEESLESDMPESQLERRHRESVYEVLAAAGVAPARISFVEGKPDESLPEYCREHGADLVGMGAIARNPFGRVFIGSTAERVLGRLPCDLLVVKPEAFRTPVARERWPGEEASGPILGVPGI
jgi:universal stress protein E